MPVSVDRRQVMTFVYRKVTPGTNSASEPAAAAAVSRMMLRRFIVDWKSFFVPHLCSLPRFDVRHLGKPTEYLHNGHTRNVDRVLYFKQIDYV